MIYDNDIELGEFSEEYEDAQDYYQNHRYNERTRELDGSLSWNDTELTWGED